MGCVMRAESFRNRAASQEATGPDSKPLSRDAELLLQARGRGRVLEQELLLGIHVAMHLLRRQRALVEAGEDQLQLARIGVDVADGEDAGNVGLELLRVDWDQVLVQVQPPI